MDGARATTADSGIAKGSWSEIFRNGLGLYSALVIGGIAMNATQMLVIAIIMPTIVRDIGGVRFFTLGALLYTIGSIVGGALARLVLSRLCARRGFTLGRGGFGVGRLTLAAGVLCVAASGSVPGLAQRILLIAAAVVLVGLTFRLDRRAANNLFPRGALSLKAPIGLALWILSLHGMTQTSVTLFLPLLLQVVHQVSPVVINFLSIVISMGWTTGTFTVSGWSGKRERLALASGPVIATTGLACLTAVALLPGLALMTLSAFVMGIGIGVYNVHLVARAMDSVTSHEYRSTASALASVRSIGTAFGAAIAGVVANVAGLGEATEPGAVGNAITAVYMFCCIPFGLAALLMFRFVRIVLSTPEGLAGAGGQRHVVSASQRNST